RQVAGGHRRAERIGAGLQVRSLRRYRRTDLRGHRGRRRCVHFWGAAVRGYRWENDLLFRAYGHGHLNLPGAMKKLLVIASLCVIAAGGSAQPAEVVAKLIRSTERFQIRARQIDSIVVAITGSSNHRQLPTAKAVYDYIQTVLPARAGHVIQDDGVTETQRDTLNFESSPIVTATVTDGGGKTTVSLGIA